METPFLDRLIENLQDHIEAIEDGNWLFKRLSVEMPETRKELVEYEAIKKALATPHFMEMLLSEENAKKMALEYTHPHSPAEYQGFILACGVIAEKISKQNL